MTAYDEQRLAELIKALPPAPQAWVEAAQELPLARERLDDIVARAEADLAFRDAARAAPAQGQAGDRAAVVRPVRPGRGGVARSRVGRVRVGGRGGW